MRKKKLVSGILLATAMLVAACGKNTTNTDTAPIQDTEQAMRKRCRMMQEAMKQMHF